MSCNHCATKFNFFHKEMGCANCGLSFCSKCLKQRCKIPTKGTCDYNVCKLCYVKFNSDSGSSTPQSYITPPERFMKRLENLQSGGSEKKDKKLPIVQSDMSIDQKLLSRLEKLKDEGKGPPPSESEIRARLAKLKGENEYVEGPSKQPLCTSDTRTDQKKTDSLLQQFINEREIELSYNPQEDIEVRLATLREQGIRPNEGPYITNLHDSSGSDDEVDKITKKIMDEVAMDERCPVKLSSTDRQAKEEEEVTRASPELPWCVLCNKDAMYKCYNCSGDLYCRECNVEVHRTWGETDHKVVPYKPQ